MAETLTLSLPDGATFESSRGVSVNYQSQANFFINTGSRLSTFYEQYVNERGGQTNKGDGLGQNVYLIPGNEHVLEVTMRDHVGNDSGSWGGAESSDSVVTRSQTLDRALNTVTIDSGNIAELSYGEYSSAGQYDPIPVVLLQSNIQQTSAEASSYTVNLTLAEATDATVAVDAVEQLLR